MNLPLVLASSSASRKMLLNKLGVPYEAISPDIDETVLPGEKVDQHIVRLAREKARKVAETVGPALIIGCDSVCILEGKIASKPETHNEAVAQLKACSGKTIFFHSGLVLYNSLTERVQEKVVTTEVEYRKLCPALIEAYLAKDQPYQCAGSIKAEGLGVILVKKMRADDPNSLIGLPLIELITMLQQEGFDFFR